MIHKRATVLLMAIVLVTVTAVVLLVWFVRTPSAAPSTANEVPEADARQSPVPGQMLADEGDWNTYHGGGALLGISEGTFPDRLKVVWRFMAGAAVRLTPVVEDGRLYVATAQGEVIALDLDGNRLWSRQITTSEGTGNAWIEAPIACFDGRVIVGTDSGSVYALDGPSGNELWHAELEGVVLGTPNVLRLDGDRDTSRVFIIDQPTGALVCLDAATGAVVWRGEGVDRSDASPAVTSGAVIFGSCAAALHVFDSGSGQRLRDIPIDPDSQVAGGVAVTGSRVVAGCRSGKIVEADWQTGTIVWTNEDSKAEVFTTPAVNETWVIAGSYDGFVYALDRQSGVLRWKSDTGGLPQSPVVAADKIVVAVDGEIQLIRLETGEKLFSLKLSDEITAPAVTRRRIFIGTEDGTVTALGGA